MNTTKEIWKHIEGLPLGYEVSNKGNVRLNYGDNKYEDIPFIISDGYYMFKAFNRYHAVHKVVASAFINNPDNYELVEHKDRDRKNNQVENLCWTSRSKMMIDKCIKGKSTGVAVRCIETNQIFSTITSAEAYFGLRRDLINHSIESGVPCCGYTFEIVEHVNSDDTILFVASKAVIEASEDCKSVEELNQYIKNHICRSIRVSDD